MFDSDYIMIIIITFTKGGYVFGRVGLFVYP